MTPEVVLAVFAHPDDESLVAGGTLAGLAAAGARVVLLCMTRGESGPIAQRDIATRETLGMVRAAELQEAADALGVQVVECLDYPDGELAWIDKGAMRTELVQRIRQWRPDVVITFGPEGLYWHPDHIAVHDRTVAALDALAGEGITPGLYYATWPETLLMELSRAAQARGLGIELWGLEPTDFGVPIGTVSTVLDVGPFLSAKLRAVGAYRSQIGTHHLFHALPDDLCAAYLGTEYFVRGRPSDRNIDWPECLLGSLTANVP
ncbi:MAG TPA: PIG-L family deacetylase [Chloroflexota bacterium]|nr:PIG-L family deacetylase [Chloroflexota bacterium]